MHSPRKLDIPKPRTPLTLRKQMTFDNIKEDLDHISQKRLEMFQQFIEEESKGVDKAKRFVVQSTKNNSFNEISKNEHRKMEERDKEISKQLLKIKALTFALETEQNSIRMRLQK